MASESDLVKAFELTTVAYYSIFYFDMLQTLPKEIQLYRQRGFCLLSVLFVFVRYFAFIASVISLVQLFGGVSNSTCNAIVHLPLTFAILVNLSIAVLFTLRSKSLWSLPGVASKATVRTVTAILAFLGFCILPTGIIVLVYMRTHYNEQTKSCTFAMAHSAPFPVFFATLSLFDIAVFSVTSLAVVLHRAKGHQVGPLVIMLWEGGAYYFFASTVVEITNLALYSQGVPIKESLAAFAGIVIPSILAQRLVFQHLKISSQRVRTIIPDTPQNIGPFNIPQTLTHKAGDESVPESPMPAVPLHRFGSETSGKMGLV